MLSLIQKRKFSWQFNRMSPAILITLLLYLISPSAAGMPPVESLAQCQSKGKKFCFTGTTKNHDRIDSIIESNPDLKQLYSKLQMDALRNELEFSSRNHPRKLQKRDAETCTSTEELSEPFDYIQDQDGWHQVASTRTNPQKTTAFSIRKCNRPDERCRGVNSAIPNIEALCTQDTTRHVILVTNGDQIETRYVELPNACSCKLRKINALLKS